ncbi:MAG TPA: alpha/beta hydrolase [Thermoanaerobaculia bacterium]|jgi:proline iminopeptidase|nr:alpha/beta hydrolase [Thermoanaerobaculia bacterium]
MTVAVNGAELFYSTRGNGPACLVLSGIGTKPYERMTPPQLSDRFRLVYVDLRGSGQSTGEPTDLTFDVLAGDLEAIRADLGVERIAVLGHSILGVLAIEYGRRCLGSVSHVITAGTPPIGDLARVAAKAASFFEADAAEDRKQVLRDNLARLPADPSLSQVILAQTPTRFFDARLDAAPLFAESVPRPQLLQHVMGTLTPAWDVTAGASALRVPIFLAHGRYDYTVPYVLWEGIPSKLPNATLEIFEQSGHQPFFEEPDRFATALSEWMNGRR